MTKPSLMDIVNAAAARFDSRPLHLASIETREELAALAAAEQRPRPETPAATAPVANEEDA